MTFGDKLKQARQRKNLTQEQLAEIIGVAKTTLTGYEKGNREPDVEKIKKIIEALEINSSWLLNTSEITDYSQEEAEFLKKYRLLDARGRRVVDNTVNYEYSYIYDKVIPLAIAARNGKNEVKYISLSELDEGNKAIDSATPVTDL